MQLIIEPTILCFSGKIGSGKSTISEAVATALEWPRASFGDYVRRVAEERGLPLKREVLQEIGASLVESDPSHFCRSVLASANWTSGTSIVIDGVRHVTVFEVLSRLAQPNRCLLVHLQTSDAIRFSRMSETEDLATVESHSTEHDVSTSLPTLANLVVNSLKPVEENLEYIVSWLQRNDTEGVFR